ncbi:hypothetical protein JGU66_03425 [Myxococcaceae bacterium JPH2]|nr:hypothetical protein [Myxococcaceae bacterium JPH2]
MTREGAERAAPSLGAETVPAECKPLLPGPLGEPTGTLDATDPDDSVNVWVDGAGNVLAEYRNGWANSYRLDLLRPNGVLVARFMDLPPQSFVVEQAEGFHLIGAHSPADPSVVVRVLAADGTMTVRPETFTGVLDAAPWQGQGTLLARGVRISSTRWRAEVFTLDSTGAAVSGPLYLASGAGAGAASVHLGSGSAEAALVVFDPSEIQDGRQWWARWFKPGGVAVGAAFQVADHLSASADLQVVPLLRGELGLRAGSAWLGRFRPFDKSLLLAAPWLASQPQFDVGWVGSGTGFGLTSPDGNFACTPFIEVRTSTGATCGEVVVPPPSPPCHGARLRLTRTGTLVEFAPLATEPGLQIRWWTGLFR